MNSKYNFRQCFLSIVALLLFAPLVSWSQANDSLQIPSIPKKLTWHNAPKSYNIKGNSLSIEAGEKTDMFRDPNGSYITDNAPKLLFQPDSNFILSAKIQHAFSSKWDAGALVLFNDSLNWIKFCFEKDYTGAKRVVSVVTKGVSDDCNSMAISSTSVYFRLAKAGNVVTMYSSNDGKKWFLVRHIQFKPTGTLKLGFLAQSPIGEKCTATFTDIKYEATKIKDPYQTQ